MASMSFQAPAQAVSAASGTALGQSTPTAASLPAHGTSGSKAADLDLKKRVKRALARSPGMVLTDMTIKAKSGVVTLTGSVPAAPPVSQATEGAASVGGVTAVANHLSIEADPIIFNGRQ
jgi:hyperosmotically inducible protein